MDYFDGNTVTALWEYAQHFSMSDNSYGTGFGPSTPGAFETVSGNTTGIVDDPAPRSPARPTSTTTPRSPTATRSWTRRLLAGRRDASASFATSGATSKNVGDLLNAAGVTWGWFQGGFTPTAAGAHGRPRRPAGLRLRAQQHRARVAAGLRRPPQPVRVLHVDGQPAAPAADLGGEIGTTDQANHQYDLTDFNTAVDNNNLPAVSFVKAGHYQDGHAGYSDPIDEQTFLVDEINRIEDSPDVGEHGDHHRLRRLRRLVRPPDAADRHADSNTAEDFLNGAGHCGTSNAGPQVVSGPDRCGFGPRLPLLVISPYAKRNFVDGTLTDQTSVLKFIEDNWTLGRIGGNSLDTQAGTLVNMFDFDPNDTPSPKLQLDDVTGLVVHGSTPPSGGSGGGKPHAGNPPAKPHVSCKTRRTSAHRAVVSCKAAHSAQHTALRFRIVRSGHVLATARTLVSHKGRPRRRCARVARCERVATRCASRWLTPRVSARCTAA